MKILPSNMGDGVHRVDAVAVICGQDINVCICGGTHHHIGACALGIARQSLSDQAKTSASVSVLTATGHKEDELAKKAAHRLSAAFGCRTCVSVGLHIDNANQEDIRLLCGNFEEILIIVEKQICDALKTHDT